MYRVYNSQGFLIALTDNEDAADFLAWINNGYFI